MTQIYDAVLVGGGVMSATLGTILQQLEPEWKIAVFERLDDVALESSNAWNNAGTGHAALCELNYMPDPADPAKAVGINEQFQLSRQFWASLIAKGILGEGRTFINTAPHMTFVTGAKDVAYLKARYETLKQQPLFSSIEYSEDSRVINQWAPLLMQQRVKTDEPFAATRVPEGTDVDFGALTHQLFDAMTDAGATVHTEREVTNLTKLSDGTWRVDYRHSVGRAPSSVNARFVFVGAGGWAIKLLQKSRIDEIKGYGVFPIGGQWLKTSNPAIVSQHKAKVYSQAAVGAPPMSVPHLDTRVVDGETSVLFGPFATFSPKFLKQGHWWDIITQVRFSNLFSMLKVGATNLDLVKYLVSELLKSHKGKVESLRVFMPTAQSEDWELLNAGQRAQVMKGGKLQFGTEVIAAADGSIAGLLGASPGASTAVPIMLNLLRSCFPDRFEGWKPQLLELVPTFGTELNDDAVAAREVIDRTAVELQLDR